MNEVSDYLYRGDDPQRSYGANPRYSAHMLKTMRERISA